MRMALLCTCAALAALLPSTGHAQSYGEKLASFTRIYETYVHNLSQLRLCRQGVPELSDQLTRAFTFFQNANGRVIDEITATMKGEAQKSGGEEAVKRFESVRLNVIKDKEDWTRKDYEAVSVARTLTFCDHLAKSVMEGKKTLLPTYRPDYDTVMGKRRTS